MLFPWDRSFAKDLVRILLALLQRYSFVLLDYNAIAGGSVVFAGVGLRFGSHDCVHEIKDFASFD